MVALDLPTYNNDDAPADALGQHVAAGTPSWNGLADPTKHLQLVWCHERCHKQENEARRRAISKVARDCGAALICVKKATKFAAWLTEGQRQPLVLLTDWREAKPCLETAAQQPPANRPVTTVVVCEQGQQFKRASAWTQTVSPELGSVHVCQDAGTEDSTLIELLAQFLRAAGAGASFAVGDKAKAPGLAQVPGQQFVPRAPVTTKVVSGRMAAKPLAARGAHVHNEPSQLTNSWNTKLTDSVEKGIQMEEKLRWVPGAVLKQEASLSPFSCGNTVALTPSMVQFLSHYAKKVSFEKHDQQIMDFWGTEFGIGA